MRVPKRLIPGPADADILSEAQSRDIVDRVIKMSKSDAISINVSSGITNNIRFAANQLSTAGSVGDARVAVTSAFGAKRASVVTNNLSDEALLSAVRQSEALARLSPDDPEALPDLGPQNIKTVDADFNATEALNAGDLVTAALTALDPARKAGDLTAAGYLVVNTSTNALGNSAKLFAYHKSTNANYTVTVRTSDGTGSGWAGAEHPDFYASGRGGGQGAWRCDRGGGFP